MSASRGAKGDAPARVRQSSVFLYLLCELQGPDMFDEKMHLMRLIRDIERTGTGGDGGGNGSASGSVSPTAVVPMEHLEAMLNSMFDILFPEEDEDEDEGFVPMKDSFLASVQPNLISLTNRIRERIKEGDTAASSTVLVPYSTPTAISADQGRGSGSAGGSAKGNGGLGSGGASSRGGRSGGSGGSGKRAKMLKQMAGRSASFSGGSSSSSSSTSSPLLHSQYAVCPLRRDVAKFVKDLATKYLFDFRSLPLRECFVMSVTPTQLRRVFQPSPRATITRALSHPSDYLDRERGGERGDRGELRGDRGKGKAKGKEQRGEGKEGGNGKDDKDNDELEDVCMAYQLFQDSGNSHHLDTWFHDFCVELARHQVGERAGNGDADEEDEDSDDERGGKKGGKKGAKGGAKGDAKGGKAKGKRTKKAQGRAKKRRAVGGAAEVAEAATKTRGKAKDARAVTQEEVDSISTNAVVQARFLRVVGDLQIAGLVKLKGPQVRRRRKRRRESSAGVRSCF